MTSSDSIVTATPTANGIYHKTFIPSSNNNDMNKRELLKKGVVAAGGLTSTVLAGCMTESEHDGQGNKTKTLDTNPRETDADGISWRREIIGYVEAVAADLVLGQKLYTGEDTDGIFALDSESGEQLWTFGEPGPFDSYSFTVDDAIYVGRYDDAVGAGGPGKMHAIEFDGSERWTVDSGDVFGRPRLADKTVYAATEDNRILAINADNGERRWTEDLTKTNVVDHLGSTAIVGVEDLIYVLADSLHEGPLLALDPTDGAEAWRFDDSNREIRDVAVSDGVAYVSSDNSVSAVIDGKEHWRTNDVGGHFLTITTDHSIVEQGSVITALDRESGTQAWSVEFDDWIRYTVRSDTAYVYTPSDNTSETGTVWELDLTKGVERWSNRFDGGSVNKILAISDADDSPIFVHTDEQLHAVAADGREKESVPLSGSVQSVVDDGVNRVIVDTSETIYAIPFE